MRFLVSVVVCLLFDSASLVAQDESESQQQVVENDDEIEWTPGPEHRRKDLQMQASFFSKVAIVSIATTPVLMYIDPALGICGLAFSTLNFASKHMIDRVSENP